LEGVSETAEIPEKTEDLYTYGTIRHTRFGDWLSSEEGREIGV